MVADTGHEGCAGRDVGGPLEESDPTRNVVAVSDEVATVQDERRCPSPGLVEDSVPVLTTAEDGIGAVVAEVDEAEAAAVLVVTGAGGEGVLDGETVEGVTSNIVVGRFGAEPGERRLVNVAKLRSARPEGRSHDRCRVISRRRAVAHLGTDVGVGVPGDRHRRRRIARVGEAQELGHTVRGCRRHEQNDTTGDRPNQPRVFHELEPSIRAWRILPQKPDR